MGGKNNKPVRGGGGGGAPPPEETEKPFHSAEYEQQKLDELLNPVERPTWDEFKKQQQEKGAMESAEARLEEDEARRFRQELDEARAARLSGAGSSKKSKKEKKHKKEKHKSKKHKKEKHKHKKKKHRGSSD